MRGSECCGPRARAGSRARDFGRRLVFFWGGDRSRAGQSSHAGAEDRRGLGEHLKCKKSWVFGGRSVELLVIDADFGVFGI